MNKGIYIALSGAVLKNSHMEVVSQNLANASSVGYKKDKISFKEYLLPGDAESDAPDGRAMTELSAVKTDFSEGSVIKTGNALDIAVDGTGFIALEGDQYTRRGDLKRSQDGFLATSNGLKVLGTGGPIKLPAGEVRIDTSGEVFVNGVQTGAIRITDFVSTESLSKKSDGIFFTKDKGQKSKSLVRQSYLEASNVDVVREMVGMIDTMREFESFQKAIQAFDEAADKVNNELGRF
jgi:flagellar basal-body rod protein FlgF